MYHLERHAVFDSGLASVNRVNVTGVNYDAQDFIRGRDDITVLPRSQLPAGAGVSEHL